MILAGWWFGTFFIFPYIGKIIIPIDALIFFRGVAQPPTNGTVRDFWYLGIFRSISNAWWLLVCLIGWSLAAKGRDMFVRFFFGKVRPARSDRHHDQVDLTMIIIV